jgi:hypothetical protein
MNFLGNQKRALEQDLIEAGYNGYLHHSNPAMLI